MLPRWIVLLLGLVLVAGCGGTRSGAEAEREDVGADLLIVPREGWRTDFSRHTVPLIQFTRGGPGKDGIPAVDRPVFEDVVAAGSWLGADAPVIELELGGEVRAYPLAILVWHEIVNDTVAGVPVVVTFCPLCNSALAFERVVDGRELDFGTTGNLRYSDLVMYDRQTESWWQQFGGDAVVGELAGTRLEGVPARIVAWADFAGRHPVAVVLSRETGYERPYGSNPYPGYDDVDAPPLFGTPNQDDPRVPAKERVVFVEQGDHALAIPFSTLASRRRIDVRLGDRRLTVEWVPGVRSPLGSREAPSGRIVGSAVVHDAETGTLVPFDTPFWFAVAAFRSDVQVFGGRSSLPRPPRPAPADLCSRTGCIPVRAPRRRGGRQRARRSVHGLRQTPSLLVCREGADRRGHRLL